MTEDRSATDSFRLLSDDTRVDILRAVAIAQYELDEVGSGAAHLAFSEIYDHVENDVEWHREQTAIVNNSTVDV